MKQILHNRYTVNVPENSTDHLLHSLHIKLQQYSAQSSISYGNNKHFS